MVLQSASVPTDIAMSKLRPGVLHLIGSFHKGGSECQAVQLARLLHADGHYRLLVAAMDKSGPLYGDIGSLNIGEIPEYKLNRFHESQTIRQLQRFAAHMKREKVAILQTHDFYTNVFGMWAGALAGVPVRIAARRESTGIRSLMRRALERFSYRAATRIVANCHEVKHQLIGEGVSANKIEVIYNGVDTSLKRNSGPSDRSEIAASFGLPTDPKWRFISIVANMRLPVKDHATFLRAARRVAESVPETAFVIAGEGELMNSIRSLTNELGIAAQTFFVGRCDCVTQLLSITEIAALSSLSEGFPNAVLEYMAAGCPVVATDVGGVREVLREAETGYLVNAGDHETMARQILRLLAAPRAAKSMGTLGRQIVQQRFSAEAQLKATSQLYDQLLRAANAEGSFYPTESMPASESPRYL